jgi:polysaccharide biosynthesis transport protein
MDGFQRFLTTLNRRKFPALAVFAAFFGYVTWNTFTARPIYETEGMMLLKPNNAFSITELDNRLSRVDALAGNPLGNEVEMLRAIPTAQKVINALKLRNVDVSEDPRAIVGGLRVRVLTSTDILAISYQDIDPERAAKIVNTYLEVYAIEDVKNNRFEAKSAREFIEAQLPIVERNVQKAELKLRGFKEKNRIVDLSSEASSTVSNAKTLEQQISTAQVELASIAARSAELQNSLGVNSKLAVVWSNPTTQQTLTNLQDVEQKLALEGTRYSGKNPAIADLKSKRAALQTLLSKQVGQTLASQIKNKANNLPLASTQQSTISSLVSLETDRVGLTSRISGLSKVLEFYQQRASVMPRLEQQQRELERQLDAAQATYKALLTKLQDVRVAENQTVGNARIISPALVSTDPVAPRKANNLIFGGIMGLALAALVSWLLEAIDKSIKTTEEAKVLSGYPVLGIIPDFKFPTRKALPGAGGSSISAPIVVRDIPRSSVSEAFRMLQTNLRFLNSDRPLKSIVVTSSVPREGKSTITANLAIAMAQLDRRVLLIDADMRRPNQHQIWEVANAVGLSNVITGQADFHRAKQTVMPNLDLLTSGMLPPNPVALLDSQRMSALIEATTKEYDLVLIDSPPLTAAADATILGKKSDGILFLVRVGVSDSGSFAFSKQILEQSGQNILGLIVNGVAAENNTYSYYTSLYYDDDVTSEVTKAEVETVSVERDRK